MTGDESSEDEEKTEIKNLEAICSSVQNEKLTYSKFTAGNKKTGNWNKPIEKQGCLHFLGNIIGCLLMIGVPYGFSWLCIYFGGDSKAMKNSYTMYHVSINTSFFYSIGSFFFFGTFNEMSGRT